MIIDFSKPSWLIDEGEKLKILYELDIYIELNFVIPEFKIKEKS